MMYGGILLLELIALYVVSRWVTKRLFEFFLLVFRSRTVAVTGVLLLEFPGTVMHELAHMFTAEILGVRTGKLQLEPESIREDTITSGSVMIAASDPFRRYAIGLAPIGWGIVILTAISYFLPTLWISVVSPGVRFWENPNFYWLILTGYFLFAVSSSMFSSPQDVHGIVPFLIVITLLVTGAYFLGLRIQLTGAVLTGVMTVLRTLTNSLAVVLAFDILLVILMHVASLLYSRIFRVRIVK